MSVRSIVSHVVIVMTFATMTSAMGADGDRAAQMKAKLEERFAKADTNGDSKLTKEEAKAGMPRVYSNFDSIDTDQAGYVTLEQIERFIAAKAGNRQDSAKE